MAAFTPGDVVVFRTGTGSAALSSTATAVFLDEYSAAGTLVQSIALPTADSGSNQTLTASGSATSEGLLTRSADGHYLVATGYDAAPGTASVNGTTSSTPRVVGRVDANGAVDTSTETTTAYNQNNIRGATSNDGSQFWLGGTSNTMGANGVQYEPLGAAASTQVESTVTNTRAVEIYNGQLYFSTGSGTSGIYSVGSGLPTTGGQATTLVAASGSPYEFAFADLSTSVAGLDTLYVADSGNGLEKFTYNGTAWNLTGTIAFASATGLTASVAGSTVTLYATNPTTLERVLDTSGYGGTLSGTGTILATAATNTAFRGVAFAPVAPAPTDTTPPTVQSSDRASASPTDATSVDYTVTFSEAVTGVDTSDFTLANSTTTSPSVTGVSGSGATYTVTINTGSGSGSVELDLADDDSIHDTANNPLGGTGTGNGNFNGQPYMVDKAAPTLVSESPTDGATNVATTANIVLNFNENVQAGSGDVTITDGSGDTRTIPVTDTNQVTFNGSQVTINPTANLAAGDTYHVTFGSGVVTDAAGNPYAGFASDALDFTTAGGTPPVNTTPTVDISQVYGGGGNSGATYRNDFIELYNYGASAVDLTGWSVQYASATGTFGSGNVPALSGSIAPGHYYLIQESAGTGGTADLPTPDATGSLALSGSNGKVALSSSTSPVASSTAPGVVDFVGYGTANTYEGAGAAPGLTNTTSDSRAPTPGTDTNNNSTDFATGAPNPHNSTFSATPARPTVSIGNASLGEGDDGTKTLSFTVTRSDTTTAFTVQYATADDTATTADGDYQAASGTLVFATGGPATQIVTVTIDGDTKTEPNETFGVNLSNVQNTVGATTIGTASGTGTIQNDDGATLTPIYAIQGATTAGSSFASPFGGQSVTTRGIVTAVDSEGYYLQDATGDGNDNTSDGIFVFTSSAPTVAVGDNVQVAGGVREYQASDAPGALTTTELGNLTSTVIESHDNALPAAVVIGTGTGERAPPTSDLAAGNAFYESLEGMRVTVRDPVSIGPKNQYGEIFTVASNGVGATGLNSRGDLLITNGAPTFGYSDSQGTDPTTGATGDYNPERIKIDSELVGNAVPSVNTGTHFADVTGILNYDFDTFGVSATQALTTTAPSTLQPTVGTLTGDADHITVGSYNIENFSSTAQGSAKVQTIANQIITNLASPDVVALQEIQDNSGPTDNGQTGADQNLQALIDALNGNANRPTGANYAFIDNPFIGNDTNGGQPGGNIRTAFVYRTDRVSLVAGSLATVAKDGSAIHDQGSAAANAAANSDQQTDTNNPFYQSRPPLSAQFTLSSDGQTITVVNNHFASKGGSGDLEGSQQPPLDGGEVQRAGQAQAVNTYVDSLLSANPNARVVVTGDLNEFTGEEPLQVLEGTATVSNYQSGSEPVAATATYTPGGTPVLTDLETKLPADQQFDYVFDGNAESLVHTLATNAIAGSAQFQPIHINADFATQVSDHDALLASFDLTPPAPSDTTPPTLTSSTPSDNATDVAIASSIVLTFSETVKAGTGNITLHPATGADVTIPVTSSQVTFSGSQVTINPTADLRPGVAYDLIVPSGAITDAADNPFAGIAQDGLDFTTSFTIPAGSHSDTFAIQDPGTFTLLAGTTRTQTANTAISANVSDTTAKTTIDIEGTLNDTAQGARAIDTILPNGLVMIGASGSVRSVNNDAVRAQTVNGRTDLTNLGQIVAGTQTFTPTPGGTNPGTDFAITYNAAKGAAGAPSTDFTSGGAITNGSSANTTALIRSDNGDAIRLGSHETLTNYGTINADGPVNDASSNNSFNSTAAGGNGNPNTSTAQTYDISRGVRINQSGATGDEIDNHGTIEGSQHGIDVGQTNVTGVVINNSAGATILGRNGSGVGSDTTSALATTVVVTNHGSIRGEYDPMFDRAGYATVDGDGDGVDVDGGATVTNYAGATIAGGGTTDSLTGTGAGGFDSNGRLNRSEGLSLGGGIVVNDGVISGADYGITVNNDSNPDGSRSGIAATTITNGSGASITGQAGFAIRLENKSTSTPSINDDTIVNAGTITGHGSVPTGAQNRQDDNPDPGTQGTLDGISYTSTANAGSSRFIAGDGSAIQTGEGNDVLSNYGSVVGSDDGLAINLEGGDDTLTFFTGETVTGTINGGTGNDTLILRLDDRTGSDTNLGGNSGATADTLAGAVSFETLKVEGGTWTVSDAESYAAIDFDGGTLDLGRAFTASGPITFGTGAQTLAIETTALAVGNFANTIASFESGDTIDLRSIGTATNATYDASTDTLTVTGGTTTPVTLHFDAPDDFAGFIFQTTTDGAGGTFVRLGTPSGNGGAGDTGGNGSGGGAAGPRFTSGPDSYTGTSAPETLAGLAGNDTIDGAGGNDLMSGNQDNDSVGGGDGDDTVYGGQGNDTVVGGPGQDREFGDLGDDLVFGNQGADTLSGNEGRDTILGGQDADVIFGGQDADVISGNMGDDLITGNQGNDRVYGGQGNDTLYGGQGNDTLYGNLGNDFLFGNLGADRFVFASNSGADRIADFSQGAGDRLDLQGQTYTVGTGGDGSAVLALSGGGTITLTGVQAGQVNAGFFA